MIYFLCILLFLVWIFMFFCVKKKNSVITYIFWGIYFPLLLYQFRWSKLIDRSNSFYFNYIFICLTIICLMYSFFSYKNPGIGPLKGKVVVTKFGKQIFYILNIGYILLYLFENYLGAGTLFPGLNGIDIHTYAAPLISYITNAQFLLLCYNYFYYKAKKNKLSLIFIICIVLMPIVTRLSRMSVVISLVQFFSLILFMETGKNKKNKLAKTKSRKIKFVIVFLVVFGFVGLSVFTQYRMEMHSADYSYLKGIRFIGPSNLAWLAPYYGYFPLSFNNLKINILYRSIKHNYVGLYSFSCLYFGLFQIDNLLGLSTTGYLNNRIILTGLATVPTGFYEYYYDFGVFLFVPILVAILITYYFEKKGAGEKERLTYRTLYYWYVPYWFFMSFQNMLFQSTAIIVGLLIYFVIKYSFKVDVEY